jgi:Effector-associated domain 7
MSDPTTLIVNTVAKVIVVLSRDDVSDVLRSTYSDLKSLLYRRFSASGDIEFALSGVEKKPESKSYLGILYEELASVKADEDVDVIRLTQALQQLLTGLDPDKKDSSSASLSGSGAIAQGPNAKAVGAGGVMVSGDVSGSIITGNNNTTINTGGGAYIGGNVATGGGTFVGRDQISNNYYGQPPADPANAAGTGMAASAEGRKVYQLLNDYFSLSDIEGLCFELGIDADNLRGETKAGKARALVQQIETTDRLGELKKLMRVQRPNLRSQLQS